MNPVAPFTGLARTTLSRRPSAIEVDKRGVTPSGGGGGGGGGVSAGANAGILLDEDWTTGTRATSPRWTIPDVVDNSGDHGLSDVAVETLSQCLQPVLDGLGDVDAETLLDLKQLGQPGEEGGACIRDGVAVRPIHNDIKPPPSDPRAVRYLHLGEMDGQYSMGIFVFPPHARIPLHDHPGMCVLSRVLYGDVRRLQLDLCRDEVTALPYPPSHNNKPSSATPSINDADSYQHKGLLGLGITNLLRRRITPPEDLSVKPSAIAPPKPTELVATPPNGTARRAIQRGVDHLRAPQTTILFPFEGNLHEFVAGPGGAAVLDVLLPPYDARNHRDCTFYEILDDDEKDPDAMQIDVDGDDTRRRNGTPCWIVPTGQPEDFHCISGRYGNIGCESS